MINVRIIGYNRLDFKRSIVRKELSRSGIKVRRTAKDLLGGSGSGRAYKRRGRKTRASSPNQYPAKQSGQLRRSVRSKMGRGFFVAIGPRESIAPHAHYVFHGTKKMDPRGPVMEDALERERPEIEHNLTDALFDALQPRKI